MTHHFPPQIEAEDEVFWRKQEARKRGLLGQPCCTQQNISWALMDLPGDFAAVVHGEFDCLNCFHHHQGASAHRFFSSRLSDHQLTTGTTQRPLEHLLRLIVAERKPAAIVVLGTCPVEVIGDRFEVVAAKVMADTGTPILAMHTSGLKMSSLTACQDWLFESLATLPQVAPVDAGWLDRARALAMDVVMSDRLGSAADVADLDARFDALPAPVVHARARRVNLLGLPAASEEVLEVLGAIDLSVNGFYPQGATFDSWRSIAFAEVAFAVDAGVLPKLTARLQTDHQQPVVDVDLPIGLASTARFYRSVAARFGESDRLEAALGDRLADATAKVEAFRARYGGARLGMAIRMLNTHTLDRFVLDGLGDLSHLQECGFEVTLLVQGPPEEAPKFAERLRARGVTVDVASFAGPFELGDKLAAGGFDAAHVPDSSRNVARRAGLPMMSSRALQPWLSGLDANLAKLGDLVRQARTMRGGA